MSVDCGKIYLCFVQVWLTGDGLGEVLFCFVQSALQKIRIAQIAEQVAVFTVGAKSRQVVTLGFAKFLRHVADSTEHVMSRRVVRLDTQHGFVLNSCVVIEALLHGIVALCEEFSQPPDVVELCNLGLRFLLSFPGRRVSPATATDARLCRADILIRTRRLLSRQRFLRAQRTEKSVAEHRRLTAGKEQAKAGGKDS